MWNDSALLEGLKYHSPCFFRETIIMPNFTLLGKPGDQGADGVLSVQLMSVFTRSLLYVRTVKEQGIRR